MTEELRSLGEYDVLARIAAGGMAEVYAARLRARPDRVVALKVIRKELERQKAFIAMFLDEARLATRLTHPNIVTIFGLGIEGGRHYLAMELLRGRTLLEVSEAAAARGAKLPYPVLAWIGARIAEALHFAHELRDESGAPSLLVHRDVNPSNIFLCANGEPKIIDFGLAKARDRISSTAVGVVKGKLAYLSPEQVAGQPIDRRADVFALGVTLWELTVGRRLFHEGDDVATVKNVLAAEIPDPTTLVADYPPELAKTLGRALAPDPKARMASAEELARALDEYVQSAGGSGATTVAALLAELFPPSTAREWEKSVFAGDRQASMHDGDGVRVWDEDAQKMTWMHAEVESAGGDAPAIAQPAARTRVEALDAALAAREASLDEGDPAALARVRLERALVHEMAGDRAKAAEHAKRALAAHETAEAHAALRRLSSARGSEREALAHLDAEIAATAGDAARADRLAERGRLLRAAGASGAEVRDAFERALAHVPAHPAALVGLEEALAAEEGSEAKLAAHLGRMAAAYGDDAELAARLFVEQAELLDRTNDVAGARAALERALAIDSNIGPTRAACVAHAAAKRDWAWTAALLDEEAALEPAPVRAAALELDAACIHRIAFGAEDRAVALLERAAARAPTARRVDLRVLDDLVMLHERAGRTAEALRARRRRLAMAENAAARAIEQRAIAALEEARGDANAAIAALREARAAAPDARVRESLDRLLAAAARTDERIALFEEDAARADDDARSALLVRASALAEAKGENERAIGLARAALVARPTDEAAVDALARLLAAGPRDAAKEARERIALHAHAAEHAADAARRVAHLESVALIAEEMLGDQALAAATYESILAIEPGRRGAVIGLARASRRGGDSARHVRALLDEAAASQGPRAEALRLRAAEVLAPAEADRALALVTDVLARDPANAEARRIEQRIHESVGAWGLVDRVLTARIAHATGAAKAALHVERAEVLRARLHDDAGALAELRAAFAIAPDEDVRHAIVVLCEAGGDLKKTHAALVDLEDGARLAHAETLARAAEIAEIVLKDDAGALALVDRALAIDPADAALLERRARVAARTDDAEAPPSLEEARRAFAAQPKSAVAIRELEIAARRANAAPFSANALDARARASRSAPARIGALFALHDLEARVLPPGDPASVLDAILALAPDDVAALDARVACALAAGDRVTHLDALRRNVARSTGERVLARIALAIALDPDDAGADDALLREALAVYSAALGDDARSVVAAHGAARLGQRFGDDAAFVAGTTALAEIASAPDERATRWAQAAGRLLATRDARLGTAPDRAARAFDWLERALDANADSMIAVALLVGARAEETQRDRVIAALRSALARATSRDAIVQLGTELARVARLDPPDRLLAIDALRRVVAVAPAVAAAWRALADVAREQGATSEAEAALESLVANVREPQAKLAALFDLADLYRRPPARAADVERVLRTALDVDPANERGLRELVVARRAAGAEPQEMVALLTRLADVLRKEPRAIALGELADACTAAGDAAAAERAMIEACACAPTAARLSRVAELHASRPADQARALAAVLTRAEALGTVDAATLVRLGRLEIEALGRPADGANHLRQALALSPTMHDARAALARGLVDANGAPEAVATIAQMMVPDPAPLLSLPDPAGALATLERAFVLDARPDESLVARELRAIAGGLDDGAHVELRARRLPPGTLDNGAGALDRATLLAQVAAPEINGLALAIAHALDGVDTKLARTDLEALGITARDRILPQNEHPLFWTYAPLSRVFAIEPPALAVSDRVTAPRVALVDGAAWVVAPSSLALKAEPEHATGLARALVRIVLGVPWIDELPGPYVHAVLAGAARRVVKNYGMEANTAEQEDLVADATQRVARAVGPLALKQKRALSDLEHHLASQPPLDARAAHVFALAVLRTELRAAFVVTGDLLATIDALRAADSAFAAEVKSVGSRALAAVLTHPVAGDVVRFALSRQATTLRRRLGTVFTPLR